MKNTTDRLKQIQPQPDNWDEFLDIIEKSIDMDEKEIDAETLRFSNKEELWHLRVVKKV